MSFLDRYKEQRGDSLKRALEDAKKVEGKGFDKDPDDWYPSVDKSGTGHAVIRFLPGPVEENCDWVHFWTHEFKTKEGGWYINNGLETLELPDPVGDYNRHLWNAGKDDKSPERIQAREQKRKLYYRSNVFVMSDAVHPENNGQIKKFKFGKAIFSFIQEAMSPAVITGMKPIEGFEPFDLLSGANFEIVIYTERKGDRKDRKYDKSKFQARGPFGSEAEMEKIYEEICTNPKWSLKQYVDPAKFKSYEVLKKELVRALGFDWKTGNKVQTAPKPASQPVQDEDDHHDDPPFEPTRRLTPAQESSTYANDDEFLKSLTETN